MYTSSFLSNILIGLIATLLVMKTPKDIFNYSETKYDVIISIFTALIFIFIFMLLWWIQQRNRTIDYEKRLDKLAEKHKGNIIWSTRASVFGNYPEDSRLKAKIEGVEKNRLKSIDYILHLGYWRKNANTLDHYQQYINRQLKYTAELKVCTEGRVRFVMGETDTVGPLFWIGLYNSKKNKTVAVSSDNNQGEKVVQLIFEHDNDILNFFDHILNTLWNKYRNEMLIKFKPRINNTCASEDNILRECFREALRAELKWIENEQLRNSNSS